MGNNLTSTSGQLITNESVNETEGTTTETSTIRRSSSFTKQSKPTEGKVYGSLMINPSTREQRRLTSVKPTNSEAKLTSKEMTHVGQLSGDLKPAPRENMGVPLKYVLIVAGSFVAVGFGILFLVCKLCKRRYAALLIT